MDLFNPEFARKNNIKINDIIRLQPDRYGTTIKVADSELKDVDLTPYEKKILINDCRNHHMQMKIGSE